VSATQAPEALPGLEAHIAVVGGSQLAEDYKAVNPAILSFYAGSPWSLGAFERVAQQVRASFTAERLQAMKAAIRAPTPESQAKLERIANGEGFFVSTGQQAGLFGGPLYTIYKSLTALRLAEELERALGVPVAALFWTPSDDHDWDEVSHAVLLNAHNELVEVRLGQPDDTPRSMAHRTIDASIDEVLQLVDAALPANEFATQVIELLRDSYVPGRSMSAAYRHLLEALFAPMGMLFTDSAHPVVKQLSIPLLRHEFENTEQHTKLLRERTDQLLRAGYHEQVLVPEDASNVMFEDEQGRERLMRTDGEWQLRRTKRVLSHADVMQLLDTHPQHFSANVLLRPVQASWLFPTLAYIGGGAELAYFGQIGGLFEAHNVPMPLVLPRFGVDLIERKVRKVLDKFELQPADLRRPFHELAAQIARDDLPQRVVDGLARIRRDLSESYADLVDATASIDPTLRGPLEGARNASHKQVDDVERKILSHLKKRNEVALEQLRKAAVHLYPNGARQERVVNFAAYQARYGPELIAAIYRCMELALTP